MVPAVCLGIVHAVALLALGAWLHAVPASGYENDDYIGLAQTWLNGGLPRDVFRPAGYPLIVAGFSLVLGDVFLAGKVVTALGAGLCTAGLFTLGRRLFNTPVGALSVAAFALHPVSIELGMSASTDMWCLAWITCTLWQLQRWVDRTSGHGVWQVAACFALAYWTRYTSALLVLPVLFCVWHRAASNAKRLRWSLGFVACSLLFLLPHFALNVLQFGMLSHDENWRNVAIHYYHNNDFRMLYADHPFSSLLGALLHDPVHTLTGALQKASNAVWNRLPRMLVGRGDAAIWLGRALLLIAAGGTARALLRRSLQVVPVLLFAFSYLLTVCITFETFMRLLMPVWIVATAACVAALQPARAGWRLLLSALLCVALTATWPKSAASFERRQLDDLVATMQSLQERAGRTLRMATTTAHLRGAVGDQILVERVFRAMASDAFGVVRELTREARQKQCEFVVIGPFGRARGRLREFAAALRAGGNEPEVASDDALAWRVFTPGALAIDPDSHFAGSFRVRATVAADGVPVLHAASCGQLRKLAMEPSNGGTFSTVFAPQLAPTADYELCVIWRDASGVEQRGPVVHLCPVGFLEHWLTKYARPLIAQLHAFDGSVVPAELQPLADRTRQLEQQIVPEIEAWLGWQKALTQRANGSDRLAWQAVGDHFATPVHGLVPLGQSALDGLWRFRDLRSASEPWSTEPGDGLVFVLINGDAETTPFLISDDVSDQQMERLGGLGRFVQPTPAQQLLAAPYLQSGSGVRVVRAIAR